MANDPVYPKNDTQENLKNLRAARPNTGRHIQEDGTIINIADAFYDDAGDITCRTS